MLVFVVCPGAAGWDRGPGREASHPFSHPRAEAAGDRGHGGGAGQQEVPAHASAAGGQGEPAQVRAEKENKVTLRTTDRQQPLLPPG